MTAQLVTSVLAEDTATLAQRARAAAQGGGLVELRLDALRGAARTAAAVAEVVAGLTAELGPRLVATVHPHSGLDRAARVALLDAAARAGAGWVDLDAALLPDAAALPSAARRILSRHTEGEPLDAAARDLLAAARPGDVIKVVPEAECAEDALDALIWLKRARAQRADLRWAVFCTSRGAPLVSRASRLLAPAYGADLVYAAPDGDAPLAAPGQPRAADLRSAWPASGPRAARLLAVVGRPLAHSASPKVHSAAQRALGLDALFVHLEARDLAALLPRLADPRWVGLSITAPFKAEALALAASADDSARALGAANTLLRRPDGAWHAANTDAPAVADALGGEALAGRRALVIGAGGAARAAAYSLAQGGAEVVVAARVEERARSLCRELRSAVATPLVPVALGDVAPPCDVIVHTTPEGTLGRGAAPVPRALLGPGVRVLDAVYRPARTALLRRAAAFGAKAVSGVAWFTAQARRQFERFHGLPQDEGAATSVVVAAAAAIAGALTGPAERARPSVLVLIGLRATGKSTLARELAAQLGGTAIDLDARVAARAAAPSAGALLADVGEQRFRALELAALEDTLLEAEGLPAERPLPILATGGGVVETDAAVERLAALAGRGAILWLDAPVAVLAARLAQDPTLRPRLTDLAPEAELAWLRQRRAPRYAALADAALDATLGPAALCEAALEALAQAGFEVERGARNARRS